MIPVGEEDEALRELVAHLELLLREHHARPGRCCHAGCLHCPYRDRAGLSSTDRP